MDRSTPEEAAAVSNAASTHIMEMTELMQPPQLDGEGDTLAIVTFGDEFEQGQACNAKRWRDLHLRMSSEKLLALGSSKISDMFTPARQQRVRRRFSFALLLPGIQYVLDFTPPTEGPELADLTAALWLPKMVKIWFLAGYFVPNDGLDSVRFPGHRFMQRPLANRAVGAILTLGHDDVCKNETCLEELESWKPDQQVPGIVEEGLGDADLKYVAPWRRIEDYCRVRHRVAIMRVLRAINGKWFLLNSAARMWTVAQVAIHLEIPQVVVDPVTQWLIAAPNTKFIEICPELAFKLAYDLRIPSVLAASFRVLVSELAVDYAATVPSPRRPAFSWAQRRRDDYGDFPSDPVEYAARAFADRIANTLVMLESEDVFGRLPASNPEWEKLEAIRGAPQLQGHGELATQTRNAHDKLVLAMLTVFRRLVQGAIDKPIEPMMRIFLEDQRKHYVSDVERTSIDVLYHQLNRNQKALTAIFWLKLNNNMDLKTFSESTYEGKQLWALAADFKLCHKRAISSTGFEVNAPTDFSLAEFSQRLADGLSVLCSRVLDFGGFDNTVPFFVSDHLLLSLTENELDFLPIWAGGLDDGSGGVFQEPIPPTEMGAIEPGPGYHTGHTIGGGTDASMVGTTDGGAPSTVGQSDLGFHNLDIYTDVGSAARSIDAQMSTTTGADQLPRGCVVAVSESIPSERFSAADSDADYADAILAYPAAHQAIGDALPRYVEHGEDEEAIWSDLGSVTGAGVEAGGAAAVTAEHKSAASVGDTGAGSSGVATAPAQESRQRFDGFGLADEESMYDFDGDDDDTSTLDGSDFDMV